MALTVVKDHLVNGNKRGVILSITGDDATYTLYTGLSYVDFATLIGGTDTTQAAAEITLNSTTGSDSAPGAIYSNVVFADGLTSWILAWGRS